MNWRAIAAVVALLLVGGKSASAHRLDEYLQATILSLDKDDVHASMRLIPGVAVAASVIASIDRDGNGVFSEAEKRAYAERVLEELSVSLDGRSLRPRLVSMEFPRAEEMREGLGEIHLAFTADLPAGGRSRKLVLENHHLNGSSVYLVNARVPEDHDLRILGQTRNREQTFYEVEYEQTGGASGVAGLGRWMDLPARMGANGFVSLYRLGMQHIAEGTDHLLFLLALLIPAPLVASGTRWVGSVGVRRSLLRVLKIVTAFTIGHSITLALAAVGFVHLPSRPVEVLIAVSILVSAIHALRPVFPGREAWVAACFGLVHGLAFANTLGHLGLGWWERVSGILAFNLGIETMQGIVVALTLPSLMLMSRTRAYPLLRVAAAVFAGVTSVGWIVERIFRVTTPVDVVVTSLERHALWLCAVLFLAAVVCWLVARDDGGSRPILERRISGDGHDGDGGNNGVRGVFAGGGAA